MVPEQGEIFSTPSIILGEVMDGLDNTHHQVTPGMPRPQRCHRLKRKIMDCLSKKWKMLQDLPGQYIRISPHFSQLLIANRLFQ